MSIVSNGEAITDERHLSRWGAVESEVHQLQQWLALGEHDAVGFCTLERPGVGAAFLDGSGAES